MAKSSKGKNAWLVTWEWCGDHAKVDEKIVAIVDARRESKYISWLIEILYERAASTMDEMLFALNKRSRLVYRSVDYDNRNEYFCGHNPNLYARIVSDLRVEHVGTKEILRWREPDKYRLANDEERKHGQVTVKEIDGIEESYERKNGACLSKAIYRNG